jgi:hypothetical protein
MARLQLWNHEQRRLGAGIDPMARWSSSFDASENGGNDAAA